MEYFNYTKVLVLPPTVKADEFILDDDIKKKLFISNTELLGGDSNHTTNHTTTLFTSNDSLTNVIQNIKTNRQNIKATIMSIAIFLYRFRVNLHKNI